MNREHNHTDTPRAAPTREDRLAAKLRENLRRRKTQARALSDGAAAPLADGASAPQADEAETDSAALPKPPLES